MMEDPTTPNVMELRVLTAPPLPPGFDLVAETADLRGWEGALDLAPVRALLAERAAEWVPKVYPMGIPTEDGGALLLGPYRNSAPPAEGQAPAVVFLNGPLAGWSFDTTAGRRAYEPLATVAPQSQPGPGQIEAACKLGALSYQDANLAWQKRQPAMKVTVKAPSASALLPPRPPPLPDGFDVALEATKFSPRHQGRDLTAMRRRLAENASGWVPARFPNGVLSADGTMWLLGDLGGAASHADEADACIWLAGPWAGWGYQQGFGPWALLDPIGLLARRAQGGINGHLVTDADVWSMAMANAGAAR